MKQNTRKLMALITSLCLMVSLTIPISAVPSEESQDNSLEAVLDRAEQNGFLYMYSDDDQIFDGSRIVTGTATDSKIAYLPNETISYTPLYPSKGIAGYNSCIPSESNAQGFGTTLPVKLCVSLTVCR